MSRCCSRQPPLPLRRRRLRFSGFGDFVFGAVGGGKVDPAAAQEFATFGTDPDPVNTNRGFGITGTDFVILADMTEAMTFLGEINFQTGRGGSADIEIDVERFFVNYQIDPRFNVQGGLFFTPIGYNNRFLYARAWLMNSIQVPDFFEEELNLFPTHSIGVAAHGEFTFRNGHRLAYIVSAANGRPHTPDGAVYARDYTDQQRDHRSGRMADSRLQGQPGGHQRVVREHRFRARRRARRGRHRRHGREPDLEGAGR